MFLYGMNTMADGMQRSAGGKMKKLLGYLTSNRLLAIIVGAVITAIIQSSGATTVMVVGFVNAGLMTLVQAVWCYYGCQYRHHDHQLDCIHERVGGGAETGIFCSVFIFHRSFPCDVHEKPQKEGGR